MKWALIVRAGTVVVYGTNFLQARFWKNYAPRESIKYQPRESMSPIRHTGILTKAFLSLAAKQRPRHS